MIHHFNHNTRRMLAGSAIVGFTFEGIVMVLYNIYLLRLGYDPEFVGIANAWGLAAFALASLLVGLAGVGRAVRPLLISGLATIALGCALVPVAELVSGRGQEGLLVGGNVIYHIGVALYFVMVPPFIMHNTTGKEHANVLSIESAAFSVAVFVGSLLGGLLPEWLAPLLSVSTADPAPYRWAFIISAISILPVVVLMLGTDSQVLRGSSENEIPSEDGPVAATVETMMRGQATRIFWIFVAVVILIRILQSGGMNTAFTFFNVYFDEELAVPTSMIGIITATGRLLGAGLILLIPYCLRRFGPERSFIGLSLLGASGLLILGLGESWWVAGLGQMIALGLNSMRFTLFTAYIMEESPMRWHSLMAGLNETTGGIGFAITSLVGGFVITSLGYSPLFVGGAVLIALGALLFGLYVVAVRKPTTTSTS